MKTKDQVKAIFLDRDGTIIVDKIYLNDPDQIEYLPNCFEGLKILKEMGYKFFVVTNQSGIPRGKVILENLNEIHRRIASEFEKQGLKIEKFYYAPYMTDSNHPMRKPNPGMLLAAHEDFSIDFKNSWMIGDKMIDVQAGHSAGTRSILLSANNNNSGNVSLEKPTKAPEYVAQDLLDSANFIKTNS